MAQWGLQFTCELMHIIDVCLAGCRPRGGRACLGGTAPHALTKMLQQGLDQQPWGCCKPEPNS